MKANGKWRPELFSMLIQPFATTYSEPCCNSVQGEKWDNKARSAFETACLALAQESENSSEWNGKREARPRAVVLGC